MRLTTASIADFWKVENFCQSFGPVNNKFSRTKQFSVGPNSGNFPYLYPIRFWYMCISISINKPPFNFVRHLMKDENACFSLINSAFLLILHAVQCSRIPISRHPWQVHLRSGKAVMSLTLSRGQVKNFQNPSIKLTTYILTKLGSTVILSSLLVDRPMD